MNTIKKGILSIILILMAVSFAFAQTDREQIDRDIRIAERILSELVQADGARETFPGLSGTAVNGTYIPGFGVHFIISPGFNTQFRVHRPQNGDESFSFEMERNDSETGRTADEVKNSIREYFKTYASTFSTLPAGEWIRVSYGLQTGRSSGPVFDFFDENRKSDQDAFSMWVSAGDLQQYKNGALSEEQLLNRLNTADLGNTEERTDLNVFGSVLETALNDTDTEYLQVTGTPKPVYLPGMGVHYRLNISVRPRVYINQLRISSEDFEMDMDSLMLGLSESLELMSEQLSPLAIKLDSIFGGNLTREQRDSLRNEAREARREIRIHADSLRRSVRPQAPRSPNSSGSIADSVDAEAESEKMMEQLQNVLDNYGSTLTSLPDNELLMITLNWRGRHGELPQRTEVRIRKSDLLRGDDPEVEDIMRR